MVADEGECGLRKNGSHEKTHFRTFRHVIVSAGRLRADACACPIGATLATVNATHADLVRCQVFLADIEDFDAMNAAYRQFFPESPPARTTVAVKGLAANASIEIECTGVVGHGG